MEFPKHYLITPAVEDEGDFLKALERSVQAGTRLLQLKEKGMDPADYEALAGKVIPVAHHYGCRVLLTGDPGRVAAVGADGLHLDSKGLAAADRRPVPGRLLLAVSGHDVDALQKGQALGADFAVISPVKYTRAHPDMEPLGWNGLKEAAGVLEIPVYALGGVSAEDEGDAIAAGAQGIAGHRGYWKA